MPTFTPTYGLSLPLINDPTDESLWGDELNADVVSLDGLIKTAINLTAVPQTASFSVVSPTLGSTSTGSSNIMYTCDATTAPIVVTLPLASSCLGMRVAFKKTDISANVITITATGADKIDGATTRVVSSQYAVATIVSDGTNWLVVNGSGAATTTQAGVVRLATVAETQTGTDATIATTPAGLAGAFTTGSVFAGNGYQRLPSGLLLQWGKYTTGIGNGATAAVTYTIPFPTAVFMVQVSPINSANDIMYTPNVINQTVTGFSTGSGGSGYPNGVQWFAIGN